MNSAGPIWNRLETERNALQPPLSVAQRTIRGLLPPCKPPPRPLVRFVAHVLLNYLLRPNIASICKRLYPTNVSAVTDTDLVDTILENSLDPGAIYVLMSGATLPPPRTVNELLNADFGGPSDEESTFRGPVLVAQGVLDPLNDARDRMERLGALRTNIRVSPLQAGHCPHDEVPYEMAHACLSWYREEIQ